MYSLRHVCDLTFVGETQQSLHTRLNGHKYDINNLHYVLSLLHHINLVLTIQLKIDECDDKSQQPLPFLTQLLQLQFIYFLPFQENDLIIL